MIESEDDLTQVRCVLTAWLAAFNAKDVDTMAGLYTRDVIYANASAPLQTGHDAVVAWYRGVVPNVQGQLRHKEEAAWQSGTLAGILGAYCFAPVGDAPNDAAATGRVFLLFRKEAGVWRMAFDMDNTPSDIKPEWFQDA